MPEEGFFAAARYLHLAVAYHALGQQEKAEEMARKLDLVEHRYESIWFAELYALQGDLDKAFVWLEKASKDFPRHYVEHDPYLNALRTDPRWEPALEQFESLFVASDQ